LSPQADAASLSAACSFPVFPLTFSMGYSSISSPSSHCETRASPLTQPRPPGSQAYPFPPLNIHSLHNA
jgi:hypothetical protein